MEETLSNDWLGDFIAVIEEAVKDPDRMKIYFSQSYDTNSPTKLSSSNGPCDMITNVQSGNYPQASVAIKKFFIDVQVSAILPQALTQPGTFTFQLPGKLEKESKAKKGITKLMLIHACGTIDYKTLSVTDTTLATPSSGMEVVLNQPRAAWSTSLSDLVWQTFKITKESDNMSTQSKYVSIKMIGKTIAVHLLQICNQHSHDP